jgi:hypothetical protein
VDLLAHRLHNQHLAGAPLDRPADAVHWLGAVQSQDYPGAKWSLGQRVKNATDTAIDAAFSSGTILRTHVLRPTWHFVTPADIRWMLQLTAPHVHALNAFYYRKLELDDTLFRRSHKLFTKALQGGTQLTRKELADILSKKGIVADKLRLAYIMMRAELDGLVCSGALRGKEQTYALLVERAPNAKVLSREEALGELALRFFTSHAPVTVKHFAWWSGLSMRDAKIGCELNKHRLTSQVINGQTFWFGARVVQKQKVAPLRTYLIPEYDEALIGSRDLGVTDLPLAERTKAWNDVWYRPVIVDGKRAGTWRRTIAKSNVVIETNLFASLNRSQVATLKTAVDRYGQFLQLPAHLATSPR